MGFARDYLCGKTVENRIKNLQSEKIMVACPRFKLWETLHLGHYLWMWALYQNLLKDKFNRDSFKKPWMFTKFLFWAIVIMTVLMKTPDYFRAIEIDGARGQYVLCESSTPGAKIVKNAQWVHDANH